MNTANYLIFAMLYIAFIKRAEDNSRLILVYSLMVFSTNTALIIESIFSFVIPGNIYYILMAMFDLMTIVLISNLKRITSLSVKLQIVCLASVILNFAAGFTGFGRKIFT